jgi:hypothetical protein
MRTPGSSLASDAAIDASGRLAVFVSPAAALMENPAGA